MAGLFGACLGWVVAGLFAAFALIVAVGGVLGLFPMPLGRVRTRSVIDWTARRIEIEGIDGPRAIALDDVGSVALRGTTRKRRFGIGSRSVLVRTFGCEMALALRDGTRVRLHARGAGSRDPAPPYRAALPLAAALARALGVPLRWVEYDAAPILRRRPESRWESTEAVTGAGAGWEA